MSQKYHCLLQTSFLSRVGEKRWSKRKHASLEKLQAVIRSSYAQKIEVYHTIHLLNGNSTIYPFHVFDIDAEDLTHAYDTTKKISNYLHPLAGDEGLKIFFSGNKGFHIILDTRLFHTEIPTASIFSPKVQSQFTKLLVKECLTEEDVQPDYRVYGTNRVLRAVNSMNFKSNLFKIPVSAEQFTRGIDEIKSLASQPNFSVDQAMNETFQVFLQPARPSERLQEILRQAIEMAPHSERKSGPDEGIEFARPARKIGKESAPKSSSLATIEGCRALRNLIARCMVSNSITPDERRILARSLADTDTQRSTVHDVLSRISCYDRSRTDTNLNKFVSYGVSCDELVEHAYCERRCDRFLKSDATPAETPSFFGNQNDSKWNFALSHDHIRNTALKLIDYHQRTTDFFDWQNAIQFLRNPGLFSHAIEIEGKTGTLPDSKSFLSSVLKPDGSHRELSHTHFETELITSLFVKEIVQKNKRFREEKVLARNVFSFGYLEPDDAPGGLLRPWIDEYSKFQTALKSLADQRSYDIVYCDDIKNFYPSFKEETVVGLLQDIFNDKRSIKLLGQFFKQGYYSPKDGTRINRFIGLPQGPVISHVVAARQLLNIDKVISETFSIEELVLVRYCDDFFFFCRDESVLETLRTKIVPQIQSKFGVKFHNDIDGGKTVVAKRDEYKNERLQQDLYKYQVRFEAELSKVDPEVKRDLIRLLTNIFGVSYDKILSSDPTLNLKQTERQLSALRWRINDLLQTVPSADTELRDLSEHIVKFLAYDRLSHKIQTTLILIYFALIENVPSLSFDLITAMSSLVEKKLGQSVVANLFGQIARELATHESVQLVALTRKLTDSSSRWALNSQEKYLLSRLEKVEQITAASDPVTFDTGSWGLSPTTSKPNLARLVKNIVDTEFEFEKLQDLFLKAGPEFKFYRAYITEFSRLKMGEISEVSRANLYRVAFQFGLAGLKDLFLDQYDEFASKQLLGHRELDDLRIRRNIAKEHISSFSGNPVGDVRIEKQLGNVWIFSSGNQLYSLETVNRREFRERNLNKLLSILGLIQVAFPEQQSAVVHAVSGNEITFITRLPSAAATNRSWYLDELPFETVMAAEIAYFSCDKRLFRSRRSLILSARNLGLSHENGETRLFILSLKGVVDDSAVGKYVTSKGSDVQLRPKTFHLPALRLLETYERSHGQLSKSRFLYGTAGLMMLNFMNPGKNASYYYRDHERVRWLLEQTVEYGRKFVDDPDSDTLDQLYTKAYGLYMLLERERVSAIFRNGDDRLCEHYSKILSRLAEILQSLKFTDTSSNLVRAIELVHGDQLLREMEHKGSFPSLNLLISYSIFSTSQKLATRVDRRFDPVVGMMSSAAIYIMYLSIEELILTFGPQDGPLKKLWEISRSFIVEFNQQRRPTYLLPSQSNFEPYKRIIDRYCSEVDNVLKSIKFKGGPELHRVKEGFEFVPRFPENSPEIIDFLNEHFPTMEVRFKLADKSLPRLLLGSVNVFIRKVSGSDLMAESRLRSARLRDSLSRLHSWRISSSVDHINTPFATAHPRSRRVIINSLSTSLLLFPRGLDRSRMVRPRYRTLVIVTLVIIALSLAASSFRKVVVEHLSGVTFSSQKAQQSNDE